VLVDDFIRYERLEHDLSRISARIGLEHNLAEDLRSVRAKAGFRQKGFDRSSVLAPEDRRLIGELCRLEIDLFGYRPERAMAAS
jgi:hypothetical protein